MTSTPAEGAAPSPALTAFHEDVLLAILSYVADVPFEVAENRECRAAGGSRRDGRNNMNRPRQPAKSIFSQIDLHHGAPKFAHKWSFKRRELD